MKFGQLKSRSLLVGLTMAALLSVSVSVAVAADKVVVIPLYRSESVAAISTVTSAGRVWMDRNLGAIRVAGSPSDSLAYGWLYQWGRSADGHESRDSPTTTTLADNPNHGSFITVDALPYDWRSNPDGTLWASESSLNNPCPAGFRLPTSAEWETERASWSSNDAAGAIASPLKLVLAGNRNYPDGIISNAGSYGLYWSGTVNGSSVYHLYFDSGSSYLSNNARSYGFSVRCLKD